jgi:spectinomycin phosphotransferase
MASRNTNMDQWVTEKLKADFGIEICALNNLFLGADMNSSVYKARARDGADYFIKLKHGYHPEVSTAILGLLQALGITAIIPPIKTLEGEDLLRSGDFSLLVYPFVHGQNGFMQPLTANHWVALGKTLRQVHELSVPLALQQQLRREEYSAKWRETVRGLYQEIEQEGKVDDIVLNFKKCMLLHKKTIQRLVDRSEQLAQLLQKQAQEVVLCHSDIHGGNVLLGEDNSIYIVDWDEPMLAPKERDLMFIGGGVGNVWNQPEEEQLFYSGYGKTAVNQLILAYYRNERIVEDIALYGLAIFSPTVSAQDKLEMVKHFTAMFEPNGAVEIALKS